MIATQHSPERGEPLEKLWTEKHYPDEERVYKVCSEYGVLTL
jgi:hypothetical protein